MVLSLGHGPPAAPCRAVLDAREVDLARRRAYAMLARLGDRVAEPGDVEHAASGADELAVAERRAGVEDERAARPRPLDAADRRAGSGAPRDSRGAASDNGDGGSGPGRELDPVKRALPRRRASAPRKSPSSRGRIACVSGSPKRQLNSSTRGPVLGEHQPGVEEPDEGRSAARQLGDHRPVHELDELVDLVVGPRNGTGE